jgi:predicted nucleic acid-binding protein
VTCVVVNDASCLIDLKKGQLLHVLMRLPYRFIVPLPIREEELLNFTPQEWRMLEDGGLGTYDLPGTEVAQVLALKREHSRLSANDCFALVTTTCHEDAILLTGDGLLRKVATARAVRVHGVLWIIDELHAAEACEIELLVSALEGWRADDAVFLPVAEIDKRLRRLRGT